jgi:hypothetical protein
VLAAAQFDGNPHWRGLRKELCQAADHVWFARADCCLVWHKTSIQELGSRVSSSFRFERIAGRLVLRTTITVCTGSTKNSMGMH